MTLARLLADLKYRHVLSDRQHDVLLELAEQKSFSLFWEIRVLFYVGVMSLAWGAGWVTKEYFFQWGPAAITAGLGLGFALCLAYCFSKETAYSSGEVASPTLAFDYVLYLGCALFSLALGTLESRFHLLRNQWDIYVLVSATLFFALAYRFDNRLVLSLALTTLAGWCGLKLKTFGFFQGDLLYPIALGYGVAVGSAGFLLSRAGVKKHFLDIYLNFSAHVLFVALLGGMFSSGSGTLYFLGLIGLCAAASFYGARVRRFLYLLYALVYGYIGLSGKIVPHLHDTGLVFFYFIGSSLGVVTAIFVLSRKFREIE